jgi:hypothetical protein
MPTLDIRAQSDMRTGGDSGIPLTQIDGVWTNGHLRFDPAIRGWRIRLASSSPRAKPVGKILWHVMWIEYVFHTSGGYCFAPDCLADIAQFCRDRTAEHMKRGQ